MGGFELHPVSCVYLAFVGEDMDGVFAYVSGLTDERIKDFSFPYG